MTDHYEALGVCPTSEFEAIRKAYRELARRHHPDAGGSTSRMVAINAAYAVLSDAAARQAYDAARPDPAVAIEPVRRAAPRTPHGVLDFGRYQGWAIADLGRHDPEYLEWLQRTPIGRAYREQIEQALGDRRTQQSVATATPERPRRARWRR